MKKAFKIIAALLALMLAVVIIIPLLFNPSDYRDEVEQLVQEQTGRELTIHDEIALSLFPWVGISVGEVVFGSAPHLANEPFARIERAEIKLRLLPLLKQRLEAGTIILHGLRLNLNVAEDGVSNWGDLLAPASRLQATPKSAPVASSAAVSANEVGLTALAIGGIQIEDAEVRYVDRRSDLDYLVKQLSLTTGPITLGVPLAVELSSQFEASHPAIKGHLALQTQIQVDPDREQYHFNALSLEANVNGHDLPGGNATLALAGEVALDLSQQQAQLPSFELTSYGLTLRGALVVKQLMGEPSFKGDLHVAEFNPRTVLPTFALTLPETADATALNRMQLAFALEGSQDQLRFYQLMLMLDETHLDGEVTLVMSRAPQPSVKYSLSIDQIDVDRYLSPAAEAPKPAAPLPASAGERHPGAVGTTAASADELLLEMLRGLDLHGTLDIGTLKLWGMQLNDIKTEMDANGGVLRLHPLKAELYQGTYRGDMRLDVRGDQPKVSLNESLQQIQFGPLLQDYMGEDKISGMGNVELALTAAGATPAAITNSLKGEVALAFSDGAVKGVNMVQMVRAAQAKLKGRPAPVESSELATTDFAEMSATLHLNNGVVKNRDLSLKSPYLRVAGKGQASLVNESIDYLAKAVISKTEQGQGGAELAEIRGLTLPVRITGTFDQPLFSLQLGDVLKAEADKALVKEKARLKAKLEQKRAQEKAALEQKLAAEKARLKREAKDKLKELFNR